MFSFLKTTYYKTGVAFTMGMTAFMPVAAMADTSTNSDNTNVNTASTVAANLTNSLSDVPGLISALAYLVGLVFGVLGILKIKDHVEQPTQTPLKEGAMRLAAGGALFALPLIYDIMQNSIGQDATALSVDQLNKIEFGVDTGTGTTP